MSTLTNDLVNEITRQSDLISKSVRDNFTNYKNAINDNQTQINNLSTAATNAETTQARPFHSSLNDRLNSIGRGKPNYVKYGGTVTQQGTPDMTVAIAAGEAKVNGIDVKWSADNSETLTAPVSNPRIDIVVANSAYSTGGTVLEIVSGAEAAAPVIPTIAATQVAIARLDLTVAMGSITTSDITQYTGYVHSQIGEIIALHPDTKAAYLPNVYHYSPCDGVELLDTVYIDTSNDTKVPNLTDDRFLMGDTTYTTGGENSQNHRWYFSENDYHLAANYLYCNSYDVDGAYKQITMTPTGGVDISNDANLDFITGITDGGTGEPFFGEFTDGVSAEDNYYTDNQDNRPLYFSVLYYIRIR